MHASHILDKLQPGYSYPKLLHFSQTIHLKTDGYFHPTEADVCVLHSFPDLPNLGSLCYLLEPPKF